MAEPDDCGRTSKIVLGAVFDRLGRPSVRSSSTEPCVADSELVAAVELVEDGTSVVESATTVGGTSNVGFSAGMTKLEVSASMTSVVSTADIVEFASDGGREDKREGASEASARVVGSELVNAF